MTIRGGEDLHSKVMLRIREKIVGCIPRKKYSGNRGGNGFQRRPRGVRMKVAQVREERECNERGMLTEKILLSGRRVGHVQPRWPSAIEVQW